MILIIDDRQKRMESNIQNLSKEKLIEELKIFDGQEIEEFRRLLYREKYDKIINPYQRLDLICLHASSLFSFQVEGEQQDLDRNIFVEYLLQKQIPVLLFSGGYSICSTIEKNLFYTANVSIFYRNISEYFSNKRDDINIEELIFGGQYQINHLLNLKRQLILLDKANELDEVDDTLQPIYSELGYDILLNELVDVIGSDKDQDKKVKDCIELIENEIEKELSK